MIRISRSGRNGIILLNRPEKMNALCNAMVRRMREALRIFRDDDAIERVFILSEGARSFCAGGDLAELYHLARQDSARALMIWDEEYLLTVEIATFPKPTIALVQGRAMGAGVAVALSCDYLFMAADATVSTPELKAGFYPDVGLTWHLAHLPGDTGWDMALAGLSPDADACLAAGLCSAIYAPGDEARLLQAAENIAITKTKLDAGGLPLRKVSASDGAGFIAKRSLTPGGLKDLPHGLSPGCNSPAAFFLTALLMRDARKYKDANAVIARDMRINRLILSGSDFYTGVAAVLTRAQVKNWQDNPELILAAAERILAAPESFTGETGGLSG